MKQDLMFANHVLVIALLVLLMIFAQNVIKDQTEFCQAVFVNQVFLMLE